MSLIESFPNPPSSGFITVCEKNAELISVEDSEYSVEQLAFFPELNAASELLRASWSKESARSAFIELDDSPKKQLLKAWYEHGLSGILYELSCNRFADKTEGMHIMSHAAGLALRLMSWCNSLYGYMFPYLAASKDDMMGEISEQSVWKDGCVRCFAWHPHVSEFAVATKDDFIHIQSLEQTKCSAIERTLKHKMQKGISNLAWKPLSSSVLAVACQSGILIWRIDPLSLASHLWSSAVQILSQAGHCPVNSLAWCPEEGLLASASSSDSSIMIWNVALDSCQPIKRFGIGGITLLRWSPDGSKLFSSGQSSFFRIWECATWACQKWTKLLGRCQSACWSADGSILLFTVANEPVLYCLAFQSASVPVASLRKNDISAFNLSSVDWETDDGIVSVGGSVQEMVWDSNGDRLAVSFTGPSAQFVALFQTRLEPTFEVIPIGFIRGHSGEIASSMHFKPKFDGGSLLTVIWSSGRIAHIPLYYTQRQQVGKLYDFANSPSHRTLFTTAVSPVRPRN